MQDSRQPTHRPQVPAVAPVGSTLFISAAILLYLGFFHLGEPVPGLDSLTHNGILLRNLALKIGGLSVA